MEDEREKRPWLGSAGISSKNLRNNHEAYLALVFLIFKILAWKLFLKCFREETVKELSLDVDGVKVFMMEILAAAPFMLISAVSALLKFGFSNLSGKIDMAAQILLLFSCIICVALVFVVSTSKKKKGLTRKKANEERDAAIA